MSNSLATYPAPPPPAAPELEAIGRASIALGVLLGLSLIACVIVLFCRHRQVFGHVEVPWEEQQKDERAARDPKVRLPAVPEVVVAWQTTTQESVETVEGVHPPSSATEDLRRGPAAALARAVPAAALARAVPYPSTDC